MGFRSQFESLIEFAERRKGEADVYMVYGREAFPQESRWPSPVPDAKPVYDPRTLDSRLEVVSRFAAEIGAELPFLVDDLLDSMMTAYDAYPFRIYAVAPDGSIAVSSDKGAAGFAPTLERIERWLLRGGRPLSAAEPASR